jgi:pimeloyl-ACP methyl ester carboxylesterase
MDLLGVEQAVIMGNSLGGWLALHFAAAFPNRTRALVLIAPSGIILPKVSFLEQTEDILINSDRVATVSEALMGDAKLPKEVLEFMTLVMENFNPIIGALPVLTDEQLNSLTMPVLYIAGTNDTALDSTQAAQRLSKFVSHAKIQLSERAHVITSVADQVMPFLAKEL